MSEESQPHVLNVNDDEVSRYVTSRILRTAGFRVSEARTGAEALAQVREMPDLVILDVRLPDISGFEVCRRIKSNPATASIIVLHTSATFVSSEKRVEGLDSGADGYLVQPMEPPELVATVRALLRARQAEEEALNAAQQWQATFDAISDSVCLLDAKGRIVRTNVAFEALLGLSSDSLLNNSCQDTLADFFGEDVPLPLERSAEARARAVQEIAIADRWYRMTIDPLVDARKGVTNFVFILADVTERKRTFEALQLNEARFRRIATTNVMGIVFTTIDGRVTDANDTFLEFSGYDRRELEAGRISVMALTPDEFRHRMMDAREELLSRSSFAAFETEQLRRDGRRLPVLIAGGFLDDTRESVVTFVLDITQRKQLEAELRSRVALLAESDRRKDEFLAMLAHELRNPLSAILTSLYLEDRIGAQDERNLRLRATMLRQTKHLARMVDDLLEVSRITRGKIQLKKERLDLCAALRQALVSARPLVEGRNQLLYSTLPEQDFWVHADPTRIEQVISNLVSNAAKYTDPGGRIDVSLERVFDREGEWAVLRVRDNGIGIPPEMLPEIFDLFVQVDQSLARSQGGLGIGLTMVQNLVRLHGGSVQAQSEGRTKGSEFIVRLPLLAVGVHAGSAVALEETDTQLERSALDIVLIEDNADARETMGYLLDLSGYQVRAAPEGLRGIELIREKTPDVALIDIGMDGMSGYEVAEQVRQLESGQAIYLVAMTGYGRPEDRERSAAAGFDLHLVKPVEARELITVLNNLPLPRMNTSKGTHAVA